MEPRRDLIETWLGRYAGPARGTSLDETHPPGDAVIGGLWAVAWTNLSNGVDVDQGMKPCPDDECRADRAAHWVATALMVANYGPDFIQEAGVRN